MPGTGETRAQRAARRREDAIQGHDTPLTLAEQCRMWRRVAMLVLALLLLVPLHYLFRFARLPSPWPRYFLSIAARICGARINRIGTHLKRDVFYISNHLSWIDILALGGASGTAFIAKAEIRSSPIVGWLAGLNRTVYVKRENRLGVAEQINELRDALAETWAITVFPEGTTTDGRSLLPFHANLLQAPVSTGKPVQPLCLFYTDAASGRHTMAPAYIGEMSLIESIDMILRAPPMTVRLSIDEPQYPQEGQHRREFALGAQKAVGDALQRFLPEAVLPQSGSVGSRDSMLSDEEGDAAQAVQV